MDPGEPVRHDARAYPNVGGPAKARPSAYSPGYEQPLVEPQLGQT